jgi:hypothetical protein
VIAAGLDEAPGDDLQSRVRPVFVTGDLIDLFDPDLKEVDRVAIEPGTRALLLDVNYFKSSRPRILAASAKITHEYAIGHSYSFEAEGIDKSQAVVRILSEKAPRAVILDGLLLNADQYQHSGRTLLLHFENAAAPRQVQIVF